MLPAICSSRDFVFCTDRDAAQYATNSSLVDELIDCANVWVSHCDHVLQVYEDSVAAIDQEAGELDPAFAHSEMRKAVRELSFHEHFDRDEVKAVLSVLEHDQVGKSVVATLEGIRFKVNSTANVVASNVDVLSDCVALAEPDWTLDDLAELLPPLFSTLRAVWYASDMFGAKCPSRYRRILRWVQLKSESVVQAEALTVSDETSLGAVTASRRTFVCGLQAVVAFQEAYSGLIEAIVRDTALPPTFHLDMAHGDWLFSRCLLGLELLDVLRAQPHLTEASDFPACARSLTDLSTPASNIVKLIESVKRFEAPSFKAVLERMERVTQTGISQEQRATAQRIPLAGFSVTLEYDPPRCSIGGAAVSEGMMRSLETVFSNCFVLPVPVKSRPYASPTFNGVRGGHALILHHVVSTDEQRLAGCVSVLDALERDWDLCDGHAVNDGDREVLVLLFQKRSL